MFIIDLLVAIMVTAAISTAISGRIYRYGNLPVVALATGGYLLSLLLEKHDFHLAALAFTVGIVIMVLLTTYHNYQLKNK